MAAGRNQAPTWGSTKRRLLRCTARLRSSLPRFRRSRHLKGCSRWPSKIRHKSLPSRRSLRCLDRGHSRRTGERPIPSPRHTLDPSAQWTDAAGEGVRQQRRSQARRRTSTDPRPGRWYTASVPMRTAQKPLGLHRRGLRCRCRHRPTHDRRARLTRSRSRSHDPCLLRSPGQSPTSHPACLQPLAALLGPDSQTTPGQGSNTPPGPSYLRPRGTFRRGRVGGLVA